MAGQLAFQQLFHVIARGAALPQNPDGNFSWFFTSHALIMVNGYGTREYIDERRI
jgi:hypothetical protein